ncbi:MAG: hypothetical protein IT307_03495 [Chloroflexi bacterium]|nr:hypothetical protein [Chloroflexota bacterium]
MLWTRGTRSAVARPGRPLANAPESLGDGPPLVSLRRPAPGATTAGHGWWRCFSLGRVLVLVGGLGLLAAYWMPWIGNQQGAMAGSNLATVLARTTDLSRLVPGFNISPQETQLLKLVISAVPTVGALVAVLAASGLQVRFSLVANTILGLAGVAMLLALTFGSQRLPPGALPQIGLNVIGGASALILLGAILDVLLRPTKSAGTDTA